MTAKEKAPEHVKRTTIRKCAHCGKTCSIYKFYINRDWKDKNGRDIWCQDCFKRLETKSEAKEYFWENHREWSEEGWDAAMTSALKKLELSDLYNKASGDAKEKILEKATVQMLPTTFMRFYKYRDTKGKEDITYTEAVDAGAVVDDSPTVKKYNEFFNGYFNDQELKYLEDYYNHLEEDFDFDNENRRDYAKKCARASLMADKAQDNYAAGKCTFKDVSDAIAQFDLLSKSANFAACKRKIGENGGATSWSELTLKLETTGHPCTRKIEWEKDDVDKTISEYKHIVTALGLDQI